MAAYLSPFLLWLAIGMVASALTHELDTFYPVRVLIVGGLLLVSREVWAAHFKAAPGEPGVATLAWAPWLIGILVFAFWLALAPAAEPRRLGDVGAAAGWPAGFFLFWISCRLIGTVVIVPIIEELAFRGYPQRRLISADFWDVSPARWSWPAVLGSALVFGLLHGQWVAGILAGVAFSYAMHLRGRLGDAIIAHATANLLLSVGVLGLGRWNLW